MAVCVYTAGEQVMHHCLLDRLILGNQGFGLFNQLVYRKSVFSTAMFSESSDVRIRTSNFLLIQSISSSTCSP